MSELTVAKITTPSNTTPLTFTTGNSSGGFIKVETANDQILFSGTPRFTGGIAGFAPNTYIIEVGAAANNWANNRASVSNTYAIEVGAASNTWANNRASVSNTYAIEVGAAANTWANTKTSTSKAIAISIVFG